MFQQCGIIAKRPRKSAAAAGHVFPLCLGWQSTADLLTERSGLFPGDVDHRYVSGFAVVRMDMSILLLGDFGSRDLESR